VDKQNQVLKDMKGKWDKQREEYQEQCILANRRGEEIKDLKSSLLAEELNRGDLLQKFDAGLTRATELKWNCKLRTRG
jgi:hypothetical protein